MKERLPFILGALLVLVLLFGFFLFQKDGKEGELEKSPKVVHYSAGSQPAGRGKALQKEEGDLEVLPAAEEQPKREEIPESYRQALGSIKGRVIEEGGEGVSGLEVQLLSLEIGRFIPGISSLFTEDPQVPRIVQGKTLTDEEGKFSLTNLEPQGIHFLGVDLEGSRATIRFLDNSPGPGEVKDLGDIVLPPFVIFIGRVIDDEDQPVPGARVRAANLPKLILETGVQDYRPGGGVLVLGAGRNEVFVLPPWIAQLERKLPFSTTRTGDDGTFRLEGVPAGLITVVVDKTDFVTLVHGPVPSGRGGERNLNDLKLTSGETLSGRVVDGEGKAVAGAEAMVGNRSPFGEVAVLLPPMRADEKGRFSCPGLKPVSAYMCARRHEGDSWTVAGPFEPGMEEAVAELPTTSNLTLKFQDLEGNPVDKVRVLLQQKRPQEIFILSPPVAPANRMKRPEQGVVVIEALPPGGYEIIASAKGFGIAFKTVEMENLSKEEVVEMQPAQGIRVRVLDQAKGIPVHHACITVKPSGRGLFAAPIASMRTDGQGAVVLESLTEGNYLMEVSHPGYTLLEEPLQVPGEEKTVYLFPGGAVEGFVSDGGYPPDSPLMVVLVDEGNRRGLPPRFTVTDLEGRFFVENLSPGECLVFVLKRLLDKNIFDVWQFMQGGAGPLAEGEVSVAAGATSNIYLDIGGAAEGPLAGLSGMIRVNGRTAENVRVNLAGKTNKSLQTDASGFFDFGRIPVGNYTLTLLQGVGTLEEVSVLARMSLDLKEGDDQNLDFDIFLGSISGRVMHGEENTPARNVRVTARMSGKDLLDAIHRVAVTDMRGNFEISSLPEGTYQVWAEEAGYARSQNVAAEVHRSGPPAAVTLSLNKSVQVKGTILFPQGFQPRSFCFLSVMDENGNRAGGGRINAVSGSFELKSLQAGSYQFQVWADVEAEFLPVSVYIPPKGITDLQVKVEVK